ncbi:MAG: polymer-forming cytoskeletal protein [Prevotella sp.]|nr:polymer-forming cytoskeletal protein [Prevotella sp.]
MGKSKETETYPSGTLNILASGTKLKGDITAQEDFRVDGTIDGNIQCHGKIIVGQSGHVSGNIDCSQIDLFGKVTGNITSSETVILKSTSLLIGDIKTHIIEIEPGARFEGTCSMNDNNSLNESLEV